MEKVNYEVDLHCHTTRSDGADTPRELVDHAAAAGMKVIAITDHDIRPPVKIGGMDAVEYAAGKGIVLIRGIEVSCQTTVEDCHIVCFGCDWNDPFFDELESGIIRSKIKSYQILVDRLNRSGYRVTWPEVLENGGMPVEEERVQKKMIFELLSRKGYFKSWSDAKVMIKGSPELSVAREKPDPLEVIKKVHECGGIAILAHPYLISSAVSLPAETLTREEYIQRLAEGGLDGIEACYTYGKTSYSGTVPVEKIEDEIRERYGNAVKFISGGSDYHADAKKGVQNPRQIGECGLSLAEFLKTPLLRGQAEDIKRILNLKITAVQCRLNILRMVRAGGHGHVGGALSAMDVVTALYFHKMNVSAQEPFWPERDRFLLSAGHKCLAQYAALAEKGYFDKKILDTYGDLGTKIPGHPDMHKLPGVEANTGALGHGLSIAAGMAMASGLDKKDYGVYVICGDGELAEGSNWEAAAAAAKYGLDNLTLFIDHNGLQISGSNAEVMDMEPILDKFAAFGWCVKEINGNDMEAIIKTTDRLPLERGKPSLVLCHTVKAKGLSFGEGRADYHFWNAKEELLEQAEEELNLLKDRLKRELKAVTV